jgi:NNP family nitrate/nitrite transporter-like MFS transporter
MIPGIFAVRAGAAAFDGADGDASGQRRASAALGLVSAIGAYGGFVIPQVLNASHSATGAYNAAFYGFVGTYVLMLAVTWFCYLRRGSIFARAGI